MDNLILKLQDVHHGYFIGKNFVEVLRGVDFQLERGKWCCILGASGSGKTTLLNLMGALERCRKGNIQVNGCDLSALSRRRCAKFRAGSVGFVFQAYCLLPELTIRENVILAGRINGLNSKEAERRADTLLEQMGLSARLNHRPAELSGGEQQRTAIARALINDPPLLLADEPTGNLDAETGAGIMALFQKLKEENPERSIVMITHNRELCSFADMTAELADGKIRVR